MKYQVHMTRVPLSVKIQERVISQNKHLNMTSLEYFMQQWADVRRKFCFSRLGGTINNAHKLKCSSG